MNNELQEAEAPTNNVSQMQQPSKSAVKKAGEALDAKSKRGFPDIVDGTLPEGDKTEGEKPETTKIASDNLPEVPQPTPENNAFLQAKKDEMDELKKERAVLTGKASLIREELKAKGYDVGTVIYQWGVADMDEEKRQRIDKTAESIRISAGKPMQNDWLGDETAH